MNVVPFLLLEGVGDLLLLALLLEVSWVFSGCHIVLDGDIL